MKSPESPPLTTANQTVETEFITSPLSTLQREIWIDQSLFPDLPHYNTGTYVRIDAPVDVSLLQRAIEYVINRYDALRAILVPEDELPRQKILQRMTPELTRLDFWLSRNLCGYVAMRTRERVGKLHSVWVSRCPDHSSS